MRSALWELFQAIASGDKARAMRLIEASPQLASEPTRVGATRGGATSYFLDAVATYVYTGDTALHVAAAANRADIARELVERGADPRARNRMGAEPLHYAAVGAPGSKDWNPEAQAATIEYLIRAGADPNAPNKSGVTPLHRAVRTRSAAAVAALLANGAEPRRKNGNGSTPLQLARRTTGRGGSGSDAARAQQAEIIRVLSRYGE